MTFPSAHIGINVTNLARSRDFYSQVFGLDVLGGSPDGPHRFAFLGKGSDVAVTLWEQSSRKFDAKSAGLHHLSFRAESLDAVLKAETNLRRRGAKFLYDRVVLHAEGSPSAGIYFEDPDGLRLEIFAPTGTQEIAPSGPLPSCGFFQ